MTLADKLVFPSPMTVRMPAADPGELNLSAEYTFNPLSRAYVGTALTFVSGTVPVRSTSVKRSPIRDRLVSALRKEIAADPTNAHLAASCPQLASYLDGRPGRPVAASVASLPTRKHLDKAVAVYTAAKAIGDFPVLAVARSFGLTHRSAARWIASARRQGLLE